MTKKEIKKAIKYYEKQKALLLADNNWDVDQFNFYRKINYTIRDLKEKLEKNKKSA